MHGSGLPAYLNYPLQSWAKQALDWRWAWVREAVPDRLRRQKVPLLVIKRWLEEGVYSSDFTEILDQLISERHGRSIRFGYAVMSGYYR